MPNVEKYRWRNRSTGFSKIAAFAAASGRRRDGGPRKLLLDNLSRQGVLRVQRDKAADDVLQLTDVARPGMRLEAFDRGGPSNPARGLPAPPVEEVADEIANVFEAFAERWQADRHHIER